jgi:hypothetical protein
MMDLKAEGRHVLAKPVPITLEGIPIHFRVEKQNAGLFLANVTYFRVSIV